VATNGRACDWDGGDEECIENFYRENYWEITLGRRILKKDRLRGLEVDGTSSGSSALAVFVIYCVETSASAKTMQKVKSSLCFN
jgi:hypothetical protein